MYEEQLSAAWRVQHDSALISRRYEFESYAETRRFLDGLMPLFQRAGYYPDVNFSHTHVDVSIAVRDETLGEAEFRLAHQMDALFQATVK
jgi:pterin-4a-carbinolamine dehydratase